MLMFSFGSYAAKDLYQPEWKNLNLDSYKKNLPKTSQIKSLDPGTIGRNTFFVISSGIGDKAQLTMQLFDFDGDGKIDLAKHFKEGKLYRSEWNLDRDDKAEVVKLHKTEDGSVLLKVEHDGQMNIWSHYFKGELRRKEFDRNADGTVDMWYYYRGGKLYRASAGKDFNPNKKEDITKAVLN